jgi:hypothetical protein
MLRVLLGAGLIGGLAMFADSAQAQWWDRSWSGGGHAAYHDDLEHRDFHRELYHRDAHRYPMDWYEHENLHDELEHDAFHDEIEHRSYHRYVSPYSSYRRGYGGVSIYRGGCSRRSGFSIWFGY